MAERTINLGREADGNDNDNRAVIYSSPQMVHVATAIVWLMFNNQLPGDVISMLFGFAMAASSNEQISRLNAAVNVAVYCNGQILLLSAAYANYTTVIYTSLTIYFMIQVPIFAATFSARQGGASCQIWWTAIIVSGLASATIIGALFLMHLSQFNLRSRRRRLRQQLRRQLGEGGLSVTTPNRWTIVADAPQDDDGSDINWITQRAAFLVILMAMSVCLLLSFTPLLYR